MKQKKEKVDTFIKANSNVLANLQDQDLNKEITEKIHKFYEYIERRMSITRRASMLWLMKWIMREPDGRQGLTHNSTGISVHQILLYRVWLLSYTERYL